MSFIVAMVNMLAYWSPGTLEIIILAPIALFIIFIILAICFKPLRKAFGLALVVIGIIECISGVFILLGVTTLIVGGLFLFIE